jgi:ribosome-binding protein aMBF1 (putative translation factor)
MRQENSLIHQDWKVVTLMKKEKPINEKKQMNGQIIKENKILNATDPGEIKKYSIINKKNLMNLRREQNLTQKQLAQKCNLTLQQIQEIENCSGLYNGNVINKINNIFKINLNKD